MEQMKQQQQQQQQLELQQRKMQEQQQQQQRRRKLQEQQQHALRQQQQQQLMQQQQQQARQEMMLKQQQQQQQQQQNARHQPMYQAQQYHHQHQQQQLHHDQQSSYHNSRQGDSYSRGGGPYSSHDNSRSRLPSRGGGAGVLASVPRADLPKALSSCSAPEVCEAVNTLTLETYGTAAEELILDEVPGLLDAIFDLMDKLNPAVAQVGAFAAKLSSRIQKEADPTPLGFLDAAFACLDRDRYGGGGSNGGGLSDLFFAPGLAPSGRGEILLLLLNALRNASFVPRNERSIGHSARAVQHFVSICSAVDPEPEVFAASLGLFGRVAKHLDISGRRAADADYEGCKWAEDSLSYLAPAHIRMAPSNSAKPEEGAGASSSSSLSGMTSTIRSPSALEYVSSLSLVFPMLVSLVDEEERSRVLSALAIIDTLAQVESNKEAFNRVPDSFLARLTELLSIPMLGSDVLAPKAGALSAEWLETNCRVLPPSIAGVDGEVRDTTLEVMCFLAGLSDTLRSRLGAAPGCIRALTRLAVATTAGERVDHQARRMASRTLTALASVESNQAKIRPMHSEVLSAAARDPHAAELMFRGLKAVLPSS
ncbi:unnamed protein product [Scytosiphon promiscuus]